MQIDWEGNRGLALQMPTILKPSVLSVVSVKGWLQHSNGWIQPLDEKIHLATSSVSACAFYGVQFIPVGSGHFTKLRTALADSLLGSSISRNSAIAIDSLPVSFCSVPPCHSSKVS